MTHISRKKLPPKTRSLLKEVFVSSIKHSSSKQIDQIFSILLTQVEMEMLIKRVGIMILLNEEYAPGIIARATNTTRQTVERIRLQLLEAPSQNKSYTINRLSNWRKMNLLKQVIKKALDTPVRKTILSKIKAS